MQYKMQNKLETERLTFRSAGMEKHLKRKLCILVLGVIALASAQNAHAAYPDEFSPTKPSAAASAGAAVQMQVTEQLRLDVLSHAEIFPVTAEFGVQTAQAQGQNVPLSVVLRNIRSRYPGKHLDTRLAGNKYKVIWLTPDGRRLDILADARTGNIISVRGD